MVTALTLALWTGTASAKHLSFLTPTITGSHSLLIAAKTDPAMIEGELVEAPWGFIDFCRRLPGECASSVRAAQKVRLSAKRAAELSVVQMRVNRQVSYTTDRYNYGRDEFWTYPHARGDCEDYALEKRRRLIAMGWPRSALLLTAARMENGQKHLVLVAITDKGDFVLDNSNGAPRSWKAMKYQWLARQSRFKESDWVALNPSKLN